MNGRGLGSAMRGPPRSQSSDPVLCCASALDQSSHAPVCLPCTLTCDVCFHPIVTAPLVCVLLLEFINGHCSFFSALRQSNQETHRPDTAARRKQKGRNQTNRQQYDTLTGWRERSPSQPACVRVYMCVCMSLSRRVSDGVLSFFRCLVVSQWDYRERREKRR